MAEIKPAEISAILKKQVEGFESGATLQDSALSIPNPSWFVIWIRNLRARYLIRWSW